MKPPKKPLSPSVLGDEDIIRPGHAGQRYQLLPQGRPAVLPGGHGNYMDGIMSSDDLGKIPELFVAMLSEYWAGLNRKIYPNA